MKFPAYGMLMIAGIVASALLWRRQPVARALSPLIFVGGLIGAIVGAKLGFVVCELPSHFGQHDFWRQLLIGRTVLGGLLGGYLGVECGKALAGYARPTGDSFALAVPLGLAIGRIGCYLDGCCLGRPCQPSWYSTLDRAGVHRNPAALVEAAFNLLMLLALGALARSGLFRKQLFHIYLIAYGVFRIVHEPFRETPRIGAFGTYQLLAGLVVAFGLWRLVQRARASATEPNVDSASAR